MERSFNDFLKKLLVFESGIDPKKIDWYIENYNNPVIQYIDVEYPGRLKRDYETGNFRKSMISVKEFFENLGVEQLFNPKDQDSLRLMQYSAINGWGFIGYQIGEAILISTDYYVPEIVNVLIEGTNVNCEKYYFGSRNDKLWKNGNTYKLYPLPNSNKKIVITDTNCWRGKFTGKNSVASIKDLMNPNKQEIIIRDIMQYNLEVITRALATKGEDVRNLLQRKKCMTRGCVSLSGLLASAHLCGAWATVDWLLADTQASDELGTSIMSYITEFSGYETM